MEPSSDARAPNTRLSEADWRQVMAGFLAGASDAALARRWRVSPSTVAAQRFKRGVYRKDRPAPPAPPPVAPLGLSDAVGQCEAAAGAEGAGPDDGAEAGPAAGGEGAASAASPGLAPLAGDPFAVGDAFLAHSLRLGEAGRFEEAQAAARLSRFHFLAVGARRRAVEALAGVEGVEIGGEGGAGDDWPSGRPVLRSAQMAPPGDWRTWLFLGGRGAGKTLAGAAWLAGQARRVGRLALVGPTYADVREVMIEGPSGLRGAAAAFGPAGGRPRYEPSRRRLVWPNGAVAFAFTAEDPDGLRGPQFHAAWADEVCAWPRPAETLAMLRLGLRLGKEPKLMLSTTPRPIAALRTLMAEPQLAVTRGSAVENAEHLAPGFLEGLRTLYGGTRLEAQEIEGAVLEALEGAVFRAEDMARARAAWAEGAPERFDRLVVAVDPPAGLNGAACGVVVAARSGGRAFVLSDHTVAGFSPLGWAQRCAVAAERAEASGPVEVMAEGTRGARWCGRS